MEITHATLMIHFHCQLQDQGQMIHDRQGNKELLPLKSHNGANLSPQDGHIPVKNSN